MCICVLAWLLIIFWCVKTFETDVLFGVVCILCVFLWAVAFKLTIRHVCVCAYLCGCGCVSVGSSAA